MSFALRLLLVSLTPLTPPSAQALEPQLDHSGAKTQLIQEIQKQVAELEKSREEMRAASQRGERPPFSMSLQELLKTATEKKRALEEFQKLIEQTRASEIPALLGQGFRSCKQGRCNHRLEFDDVTAFIASFGGQALQPLLSDLKNFDPFAKETLLFLLLRTKPSSCPDEILNSALLDPTFRVRSAALSVIGRNCPKALYQEKFQFLLARENESESILSLLDLYRRSHLSGGNEPTSELFRIAVRLFQEKKLRVEQDLSWLCGLGIQLNGKIEGLPEANIPFWLDAFERHPHPTKRSCIVETLFLNLQSREQLLQLRRVFNEAARYHYGFQAIASLHESKGSPAEPEYWGSIPNRAKELLSRFQEKLQESDWKKWMEEPGTRLGEKLLLSKWLNQDPIDLLPDKLRLKIQVFSQERELLSKAEVEAELGKDFQASGKPIALDFPIIEYRGQLALDAERLTFKIHRFLVGLKPAGAMFDATIPISGAFETPLRMNQKPYLWRVELAE